MQGPEMTNAVSILQEYIQSCSDFPPHARILTWSFEKRLQEDSLLQFRATVSFVYKQVPHFFRGSWQTSKKKAQRDTAERVRRLMMKEEQAQSSAAMLQVVQQEVQCLLEQPERFRGEHVAVEIEERLSPENVEEVRALLLVCLDGVPHRFAGAWLSPEQALRDAAERLQWFLGAGDLSLFRASLATAAAGAEQAPPAQLVDKELADDSPGQVAGEKAVEEKTILMQVQNALQKTFSKDTPAGEKVWVWSYEPSNDPQLFRAVAEVPALGRRFQGDWCRGKKLAQRNACLAVKAFLDAHLPAES